MTGDEDTFILAIYGEMVNIYKHMHANAHTLICKGIDMQDLELIKAFDYKISVRVKSLMYNIII